jgi:3-phosphoshikimate 1-carboxyvinyltransferase
MVRPARRMRAVVRVPGDKSISHRYALLAALADGASHLYNFAPGDDGRSTLACIRALGAAVTRAGNDVHVTGRGVRGLSAPPRPLDAGNSGTTLRLLAGILAAHPFASTLVGDASLSRRPMRRIIAPLTRMGARIESDRGHAPLHVVGGALHGIGFEPDTPSAQVKSAVLLAGLQADGATTVAETVPTRDHTELALRAFGATVDVRDERPRRISVAGGQRLQPADLRIPGDVSSAAFWAVAAAGIPGARVSLEDVGLNPSRTAYFSLLRRAGADVAVATSEDIQPGGEPAGTVTVKHAGLGPLVIAPEEVPSVIDELPALAALAAFGVDVTVSGAGELRVKESDRISALVAGFRALGADADEHEDGFHLRGRAPWTWRGGEPDAAGDHRLAMAFAIAALGAAGPSIVHGADSASVSYPEFFDVLSSLDA